MARAVQSEAQQPLAYRENQGIDPASVSLAVIVQRMVEGEAAGIMFTADPVSGRRDRVVIEAAWGLGEAVVGGKVTPDTLVAEKGSGGVLSRETANKNRRTVYVEGGVEERWRYAQDLARRLIFD